MPEITDAQFAEFINNMSADEKNALVIWMSGVKIGMEIAAQKNA